MTLCENKIHGKSTSKKVMTFLYRIVGGKQFVVVVINLVFLLLHCTHPQWLEYLFIFAFVGEELFTWRIYCQILEKIYRWEYSSSDSNKEMQNR
jgi:hypothetical protein